MVAVVIPAYKRDKALRNALRSLTLQTKKSFYVVVVDDHSPTPLKGVVDEFKRELHIKYIYLEENGGPGVARQIGLNYCYEKGFDFVVFLDSDDCLFPQALARLEYEIITKNADIVSASFYVGGKVTKQSTFSEDNKTFVHGKIYRTQFLKENNITFPKIRTNEDLAFNLKAIETSNKVELLDEILHSFMDEKTSITRCGKNDLSLLLDYIEAVYDATVFLKQNNCFGSQMVVNIFNCYQAYQKALILSNNIPDNIKQHLRWLLNLNELKQELKFPRSLARIADKIPQIVIISDKIFTFPQTFVEWIEEFSNEGSNN